MPYEFFNNATKIIKAPNMEMGKTKKEPIFKIESNAGITINSINPITVRTLNLFLKSVINSKKRFFFL